VTAISSEKEKARPRARRLAAGGIFLLIFGITLGVLLTKSIRPRMSEQDNITGDFLTGTPGGIGDSAGMAGMEMGASTRRDSSSLLSEGRAAFERQEWPKAIDSFKRALAIDPNHPEAHTYMGLILAQGGDADGALMAFDQALSSNPDFPLALWGKGMVLYRAKEDFSGARDTLEKLVDTMPPSEERKEIQKTIAEIAQLEKGRPETSQKAKTAPAQILRIQGIVSIDPKLEANVDGQAVLFISARSANSPSGPPLAVRRVDRPVFPFSYSLGPEHVMVPGVPFTAKVVVSARLDKDRDPTTREAGNLSGEYKKNPVEIGSERVDIIVDQVVRQ